MQIAWVWVKGNILAEEKRQRQCALVGWWAPTDSATTKQPRNNRRVMLIRWQCIWSSLICAKGQPKLESLVMVDSWPWHFASLLRRYVEESSNFVPGGVPKIYICMLAPPSFIGIPLNGDHVLPCPLITPILHLVLIGPRSDHHWLVLSVTHSAPTLALEDNC